MKEELQGKLVEILTSIQTAAGKASDFAMEQLPDIAQSYVLYGRVHQSILVVLLIAALMAVVHYIKKRWPDADDVQFPIAIFGGSAVVCLILAIVDQMGPLFLVWFAPKVWLLKEIATMLK